MTDTTADPTPQPKRTWPTALIAALVVSGALLLGGAGRFALASALHAGDRTGPHIASFPGGGLGGGPGQQWGGPPDAQQN